jgi:Cys-rich protein (TIGR01571 family)
MAVAGSDDAPSPATRGHGGTVRLLGYGPRTPTPQLTERLLDDKPQQRPHCCVEEELPSFWRWKPSDRGHVEWASVRQTCKEWIKNPMNVALLLWLLCVGVSGGMLVLLLLGLLDGAFPATADRNRWIEINNQVLNALFTLMSLYQHPALCHHLFLLCRWRPPDAAELRAAYCKEGAAAAPRHGDRAHVAVVVALLHLTVLCQYVLCGLYWGYTRTTRPELAEDGFFALGILAPVAAAVYTVCSPLGKGDRCHDLASCSVPASTKAQPTPTGHVVLEPDWAGGMLDCGGGDAAAGCLSLSCTFCVFGWNMERLGLGNAYVHAVTFALLCFAPLWVLGVSALHIHSHVVGDAVGGAGVLLCACGLLYGGYWRIQMRRRFGLPGTTACCGSKSLTDYARWLFCWPCALAQEVRTASMYHVDGEVFYSKTVDHDDLHADSGKRWLAVSKHRDVFSAADTVAVSQQSAASGHRLVVIHDETTMAPPVQVVVVQVEDKCSVVRHGETSGSSSSISSSASEEEDVSFLESNREMLEDDADRSTSSDGSWRVEKVKRLINMVTLVSLLILLYTRGIIL